MHRRREDAMFSVFERAEWAAGTSHQGAVQLGGQAWPAPSLWLEDWGEAKTLLLKAKLIAQRRGESQE